MPKLNLTTADAWIVINALHVAAEQYRADAEQMAKDGHTRLALQFKQQEKQARAIQARIEDEQ